MTTMESERKARLARQRYGMLRTTNAGQLFNVEYVDRHGMYHRCESDLNRVNANLMLAKWQRNYPDSKFEILKAY